MMYLQQTWFGLALAMVLATGAVWADDKAKERKEGKDEKFDAAKLIGTWKYVSGEKNGEKVDEERLKTQTVVITKETFTLKSDEKFVMKYELGDKKTPVTIKFEMTESPFGAGAKSEGIIELKGDDLKLCYAPMGGEAPKKFEAKEGSQHFLFVLKRSK